jgi:hypothetical protein
MRRGFGFARYRRAAAPLNDEAPAPRSEGDTGVLRTGFVAGGLLGRYVISGSGPALVLLEARPMLAAIAEPTTRSSGLAEPRQSRLRFGASIRRTIKRTRAG